MSGLVDMVDASTVQDLEKMGFSADQVKIAMVRCGNDVNAAVDMLTSGKVPAAAGLAQTPQAIAEIPDGALAAVAACRAAQF